MNTLLLATLLSLTAARPTHTISHHGRRDLYTNCQANPHLDAIIEPGRILHCRDVDLFLTLQTLHKSAEALLHPAMPIMQASTETEE